MPPMEISKIFACGMSDFCQVIFSEFSDEKKKDNSVKNNAWVDYEDILAWILGLKYLISP